MQTTITKYGPCKFYGKDEYIGRSLYNYGEWSGEECEKIASLASDSGGLCLDVGANIGFMTMAMLAARCRVMAFEPQPELFKILIENCPGADCRNVALSSSAGTAIMPRLRYGARGNYGGASLGTRSELGSINVECITLDSLELDVSFIKLDVEGHELEVLRGGLDTLNRCSPIIYMEDDRPGKSAALREFLGSLGYRFKEHRPPMYRENNFKGFNKNIWEPMYYESHNVICLK